MLAALPAEVRMSPSSTNSTPGSTVTRGMPAGELAAFCPVRRGAAAVQQPRGGQGEGAGAQRHDAAAPRVGLPQDPAIPAGTRV